MSAIDAEEFPKGALIAVGALVAFTLLATTAVRLQHVTAPAPAATIAPAPAASRDLRFADGADGSIRITEAASGRAVASVAPGQGGFVRGVMRGLARDRQSRHIGAGPAFRLSLMRDGGLWLEDLATGRRIDLESFGVSNRDAFAALLAAGGGRS